MRSQFIVPEHKFPDVEPFYKEYFQKYKRNLRDEAIAQGQTCALVAEYSKDLLSNLVTKEQLEYFLDRRKIILSKSFTFACSHALPFHEGNCKYLHGHEWKIEVFVHGAINDKGMVMDFSDLKKAVNDSFIEKVDHSYLNTIIANPTAENICYHIWNVLQYEAGLKGIHAIQVWETPTSCASLTIEQMSNYAKGMWSWKL